MLMTLKEWLGTFWKIMISPRPRTFLAEAKKADGKFASAVGWLVFFAAYLYILTNIFVGPSSYAVLLVAVILLPAAVVLFTSAMYYSYRRFTHGKEFIYDRMLYLTVAILLPLPFIFVHVALVLPAPVAIVLSYALLLYQTGVVTMALMTIARIKYWQALLCVFVSVLAALLVSAVILILVYGTIMAPAVTG